MKIFVLSRQKKYDGNMTNFRIVGKIKWNKGGNEDNNKTNNG